MTALKNRAVGVPLVFEPDHNFHGSITVISLGNFCGWRTGTLNYRVGVWKVQVPFFWFWNLTTISTAPSQLYQQELLWIPGTGILSYKVGVWKVQVLPQWAIATCSLQNTADIGCSSWTGQECCGTRDALLKLHLVYIYIFILTKEVLPLSALLLSQSFAGAGSCVALASAWLPVRHPAHLAHELCHK